MAEMQANFCPRCGAHLSPQARFCEDCGSPLTVMLPPQPAVAAALPPKKSRLGLWIGILLLLAAACGIMMIALYFLL